MNEDLIRCIDCESCIDGKCEFCNGAEIEDVNEEFFCMYFSKRRWSCTTCRFYGSEGCGIGRNPKTDNDNTLGCYDYEC